MRLGGKMETRMSRRARWCVNSDVPMPNAKPDGDKQAIPTDRGVRKPTSSVKLKREREPELVAGRGVIPIVHRNLRQPSVALLMHEPVPGKGELLVASLAGEPIREVGAAIRERSGHGTRSIRTAR